jgi:hypothetical protein
VRFWNVGYKRRVVYAPLKAYDLRIGNSLYFLLDKPAPDGARVAVEDPESQLDLPETRWEAAASPLRLSPALHVNQTGYYPAWPKRGFVGYYLGSLGELDMEDGLRFEVRTAEKDSVVFTGTLRRRLETGYDYPVPPYQNVMEADFSPVAAPGVYRLAVPGFGASMPFIIHAGAPAAFARACALGLYHQRCGAPNEMPFTRFTHDACHTAPAEVPTPAFDRVNAHLEALSKGGDEDTRLLNALSAAFYPFVRQGGVDARGGHHDAGDYSKYTIHSAHFIHYLICGTDALPGVAGLDNLGLPESGDGIGDLLQIARWEADFLAKMQDDDGGFYFLVYPRDRRYENDVLPDHGDPQVVFPKNTAATAAATAALAQIASSPHFRRAYPEAADGYLARARKGWDFLMAARKKFGSKDAYQRISHYGDQFADADELVWAAAELFLATREPAFHAFLLEHFDPADRSTRRWGWWRLFEGYGNAARSYAFAPRSGRLPEAGLDRRFYEACVEEIKQAGADQAGYAQGSAYGVSFPFENKRFKTAGWFMAMDAAFDLVAAYQIEPNPAWFEAILTNANYEAGANPNNLSFLTGLGRRRPAELVHQYAQNDERTLPPSGIPVGNIQEGFEAHPPYGKQLSALTFPPDRDKQSPYPLYDRWGDSFNTHTEATIVKQARALAGYAFLMAQTDRARQPWRPPTARIAGLPDEPERGRAYEIRLEVDGMDPGEALTVWEGPDQTPVFGATCVLTIQQAGPGWIEAEAAWPDGRRVFARKTYDAALW